MGPLQAHFEVCVREREPQSSTWKNCDGLLSRTNHLPQPPNFMLKRSNPIKKNKNKLYRNKQNYSGYNI